MGEPQATPNWEIGVLFHRAIGWTKNQKATHLFLSVGVTEAVEFGPRDRPVLKQGSRGTGRRTDDFLGRVWELRI